MKIYTKKGDRGTTSLFRGGRVAKSSERVEAYGTVDELNSYLGWIRANELDPKVDALLEQIQNELFVIGSDLATPLDSVKEGDQVMRLPEDSQLFMEEAIDEIQSFLEPLMQFILPGGSIVASMFHVARTITRRAERAVVRLENNLQAIAEFEEIEDPPEHYVNPALLVYLNRLSDFFFVLARYQNKMDGFLDIPWEKPQTISD